MKPLSQTALFVSVSILLFGCERTYGKQACRMEHEVLLARTDSVSKEVAVVALRDGAYLGVWSANGGIHVATFNSKGSLMDHPRRIPKRTPREEASSASRTLGASVKKDSGIHKTFWPGREQPSIDAEDIALVPLEGGGAAVAMVAQSNSAGMGGAYLALLSASGEPEKVVSLGPAGEFSERVAIGVIDDSIVVAWHDGLVGTSKIRLVRVKRDDFTVEKRATVEGHGAAASPSLAAKGGVLTLAWSETGGNNGGANSDINLAVVSAGLYVKAARTVATSRFVNPSPRLAISSDGIALVFRDDEDSDDTPEYHFVPLTATGIARGERQRISTADGLKGPSLIPWDDGFIGVTIRSFQRNLLIGLNRMDRLGHKLGGEFQVYADKTDFVRVDIAENGGEVMILYAEDRQDRGRILAGSVVCAER